MKFVIFAPRFDDNIGGVIVLHKLCHMLNTQGQEAYLWINFKPLFDFKKPIISSLKYIKYFKKILHRKFTIKKEWNTPIATYDDLDNDTIVIYPEIVDGNPLRAKHVVRWLLHKPGFHSGKYMYAQDDLIMGYGKNFSTNEFKINDNNLLTISYIMTDIYKQTNFSERSGSCYMVRKGKDKQPVHDYDSVCVDNYSHEALSKIFNEKKYFISYDPYTFYSIYAALCGCISIIIPDENISKEEWYPDEANWYGLAYGFNDLDFAIRTKSLMVEKIKDKEERDIEFVNKFIYKAKEYFRIEG